MVFPVNTVSYKTMAKTSLLNTRPREKRLNSNFSAIMKIFYRLNTARYKSATLFPLEKRKIWSFILRNWVLLQTGMAGRLVAK